MTTNNEYPAMVSGDWMGDDDHAGYGALITDHWNGWACPLFTQETAVRIVSESPDVLRWDGEVVVYETDDSDEPERYEPDERGLYAIGSGSWCWDELGDPPAVIHLTYTDTHGQHGIVAGWFASDAEAQPRIDGLEQQGYTVTVERSQPATD